MKSWILLAWALIMAWSCTAADQSNHLVLDGKFSIAVPVPYSADRAGPSVATPYESYILRAPRQPPVAVFVIPYEVSTARSPGKCTVSAQFDRGNPKAPAFCEHLTLTHTIPTELGPAKWSKVMDENSRTMNSPPPPPEEAYVHTYVVIIPIKANHVMIEFWASTVGDKTGPTIPGGTELWPLIKDKLLPSLTLVN
jgi:hypothetical protein